VKTDKLLSLMRDAALSRYGKAEGIKQALLGVSGLASSAFGSPTFIVFKAKNTETISKHI